MPPESWSKYEWLDRDEAEELMAGCIGVSKGLEAAEVQRALGVDEASEGAAMLAEAWQMSKSEMGNDVVQVTTLGDAVVTVEPNGWHGVVPEIAAALSRRGRYAAYFWNINGVMQFVFAEDGVIVRDFDPLLYDNDGEHERALPEEAGLPFPSGADSSLTPARASLALIERLTGVEIRREWLVDSPHPTFRVDPEPTP